MAKDKAMKRPASDTAVHKISSSPEEDVGKSGSSAEKMMKDFEKERMNLVLTKRPFATLLYFSLAMLQYTRQLILYIVSHKVILSLCISVFAWTMFCPDQGPHEPYVKELSECLKYAIWWVGLGIASSIGLGSGLHTFVLYLGPHIAMFTRKATLCGRVDLKTAAYDTIVFGKGPTWEFKECVEFGEPYYVKADGSERFSVPLMKILQEVHWEAVLWGVGTALGELPPYFVSKAARQAGERLRKFEDLGPDNATENPAGAISGFLNKLKFWVLVHFRKFNFWTILLFASVPNPLFDLAGMMCGQLLVPFWRFFIPTMIGKAIIKTHIQTVFVIILCNNHLIEQLEASLAQLLINIPAISGVSSRILLQLEKAKQSYATVPEASKSTSWKFSPALVWNTFVWVMLISFFSSIINTTAQSYLYEQHNKKIEQMKKEK